MKNTLTNYLFSRIINLNSEEEEENGYFWLLFKISKTDDFGNLFWVDYEGYKLVRSPLTLAELY